MDESFIHVQSPQIEDGTPQELTPDINVSVLEPRAPVVSDPSESRSDTADPGTLRVEEEESVQVGSNGYVLTDEEFEEVVGTAARDRDFVVLRKLSIGKGGFRSDRLRRILWPVLLGVDDRSEKDKVQEHPPPQRTSPGTEDLPKHRDESQVRLDVNRSFISFPVGASVAERNRLKEELDAVIVGVLRRHPSLNYFQGFHDIVSVLLLTFNDLDRSTRCTGCLALHRIRDSMGTGLEPVMGYLRVLKMILVQADPELSQLVEQAAALPYFSLSWVLTLLAHDLTSLSIISRLFDFLLAHNPIMVSYLGATIVMIKKGDLDSIDPDLKDDPAVLHHTLSSLPKLSEEPAPKTGISGQTSKDVEKPSDADMDGKTNEGSTGELDGDRATSPTPSSSTSTDYDALYGDPDVYVPTLDEVVRSRPHLPTPPKTPSPEPEYESVPRAPTITIEDVIRQTYALYLQYPPDSPSMKLKEIMGPNSCVFTWERSLEGTLTAEEAERIVREGKEIVYPMPEEEEGKEKGEEEEAEKRKRRNGMARKKTGLGGLNVGAWIAVAGVTGVVLALYGPEIWAYAEDVLGMRARDRHGWWYRGAGRGVSAWRIRLFGLDIHL